MSTSPNNINPEPAWTWPEDILKETSNSEQIPTPKEEPGKAEPPAAEEQRQGMEQENTAPPPRQRHYRARQCRICLEEVQPTFEPPAEGVSAFFNPAPRVTYISEDPESGRLLRPCKCRGSQAYVHEGCLQEWRFADPGLGARNYWQCPTCKFQYRLERMKWSRAISSTPVQLVLTIFVMFVAVFLLGFVADPVINLYFEPASTLASIATGNSPGYLEIEEDLLELDGWTMHFLKGLTSIGVLGFLKVFITAPLAWWNFRQGGLFGGFGYGGGGRNGRVRAGVTGRDRTENTFWIVVIIGILTMLYVSAIIPPTESNILILLRASGP